MGEDGGREGVLCIQVELQDCTVLIVAEAINYFKCYSRDTQRIRRLRIDHMTEH